MANELIVINGNNQPVTLRNDLIGTNAYQAVMVVEHPEVPASTTGATIRYQVTSTAVSLVPPTAGARFARLRCYETTTPTTNPYKKLYYRQDGVNPLADGTNASGFLCHNEMIIVKLATFGNFRMIRDSADAGIFLVHVEWLNHTSS